MTRKHVKETRPVNLRIVTEATLLNVDTGQTLTISQKAFDFDSSVKESFKRFDGALRRLAEL